MSTGMYRGKKVLAVGGTSTPVEVKADTKKKTDSKEKKAA